MSPAPPNTDTMAVKPKPTCQFRNSPKRRPSTGRRRPDSGNWVNNQIWPTRNRNGLQAKIRRPMKTRLARISRSASRVMGQKRTGRSGNRASYLR